MKYLALLSLLALAACDEVNPIDQSISQNGVRAEMVADIDGCRLWKTRVEMRIVFFARCPNGEPSTTQWTTGSKAKTTHNVTTEYAE